MKKYLLLSAAALSFIAAPVMAEEGKHDKKGMFEKHDTNGDGIVTKEEFLAHAETKFAELDADGDGSISKAESDAKREEWKSKMKERRAKMKDHKEHGEEAPPAEAPPVE